MTTVPLLISNRRKRAKPCFFSRVSSYPPPSKVMSEVIDGSLALRGTLTWKVMVSASLPAGQPPLALSVLAAVMASARAQRVPFKLTGDGNSAGVAVAAGLVFVVTLAVGVAVLGPMYCFLKISQALFVWLPPLAATQYTEPVSQVAVLPVKLLPLMLSLARSPTYSIAEPKLVVSFLRKLLFFIVSEPAASGRFVRNSQPLSER